MLRTVKTKIEAAELLGIHRDTFSDKCAEGLYTWPPESNASLIAEHVEIEKRATDLDDARFRRARADNHEIDAATKRGLVAPIELFEEQIVSVFGLSVQEAEGAEARLRRVAGETPLAEAIRSEFRGWRESLARSVERYCESLEERARSSAASARSRRGRVGARGKGAASGERGAGAVQGV